MPALTAVSSRFIVTVLLAPAPPVTAEVNPVPPKIKKFESNQPIGAWVFVVILNIVGFAGYFYLKVNHIQLGG